jgi:hypothetical protein
MEMAKTWLQRAENNAVSSHDAAPLEACDRDSLVFLSPDEFSLSHSSSDRTLYRMHLSRRTNSGPRFSRRHRLRAATETARLRAQRLKARIFICIFVPFLAYAEDPREP